jgi:hypothetical protein
MWYIHQDLENLFSIVKNPPPPPLKVKNETVGEYLYRWRSMAGGIRGQ